jgi:recombination protein RecT
MNAQTQNTPAQSPAKAFQVYMQKYKSQLEMALPKHMTADRMMRLTLTEFSKNPKLQQCSSNSIFSSIIIASQLGLEPGVNGQGYLVPYNGTCTFIPGWKGLVDLAQRGGRSSVWTGAVYEGDEFDYMLGDSPYCRHKPCGEFDESKLTYVYAIGRVKDSEMPIIEVWPVRKVREHFKKTVVKSLQPNHYSHKHFEAYAKKVALLQVLKYMPQSIELSNAVDVSSAVEQGKGVTIDGDFVNVENNNQEQLEAQNSQNSTQNDVDQGQQQNTQEVQTFDQEEVDYAPTFAQIKKGILTAKTQAHLEVMEEQALDHANSDERKQLMTLVKAQGQKFEVATAKKSDPQTEEAPPVEEKKARTSRTPKVVEAANDQNSTANETVKDSKVAESSADPIKSNMAKEGLKAQISEATTVEQLKEIAATVRTYKLKLTDNDMGEVLADYSARKKFLEEQQDMFAGVVDAEISYVESAILKIQNAKSQDDINDVYADPAFDELSGADRERLDKEAQQRESELQD